MKNIYTPAKAAFGILEERRNNVELRERVAEYLGYVLPDDSLACGQPVDTYLGQQAKI
jgi:hypothetical protein